MITSPDEREQLAKLNLLAGKRAKASAAYASALTYLVAGATFWRRTVGNVNMSSPSRWSWVAPNASS